MSRRAWLLACGARACGARACGALASVSTAAAPVAIPQVFMPGSLSGPASEDCLSLTPDGNTAVYDLSSGKDVFIVTARRTNGAWSAPSIAPFSGVWKDHDPALSPDGTFLVFASNRPTVLGNPPQGNW